MPRSTYATDAADGAADKRRDTNPKAQRAAADGKPEPLLVEPHVRHTIAAVMKHGADKYGVRNWRVHPIYVRTYVNAIQRHLDAWAEGEDIDPDSGLHHLAHIGANVVVVLDADANDMLVDDRDFAEAKPAGHAANQAGGEKPATNALLQSEHARRVMAGAFGDADHTQELAEPPMPYCSDDELDRAHDKLREIRVSMYPGPQYVNCMGEMPSLDERAEIAAHGAIPVNTGEHGSYGENHFVSPLSDWRPMTEELAEIAEHGAIPVNTGRAVVDDPIRRQSEVNAQPANTGAKYIPGTTTRVRRGIDDWASDGDYAATHGCV